MKTAHFLFLIILISELLSTCNKENGNPGITNLNIHLTDNPFNAPEVDVHIEQVLVRLATVVDPGEWTDLETRAGIYNLLDYQNNVDTLIAHIVLLTATLTGIRFVLGPNNSIKIENVLYPLTIPGGSESGLKIKLNKPLQKDLTL